MRKMSGKLMLCLLLLFITLSWAEDAKMSGKSHNNTVCCQGKPRLFARRKNSLPQERRILKNKLKVLNPIRRCSRLMDSCSPDMPCCDPFAFCHCRLFKTICNCWKNSSPYFRKI